MREWPKTKIPAAFKDVLCPYPKAETYYGKYGAINYTLDGPSTGELLVCFHGLNAARTMFKTVGEALARGGMHVLNFDMYGHGLSNAPNVSMWCCRRCRGFPCGKPRARYDLDFFVEQTVDLLDGLGLGNRPVNLVGFSFGGSVAVAFASRYPDRVLRLCLLSPAGCLPKIPKTWYLLKTIWCCLIPLASYVISPCCYRKEKWSQSMKGEDPETINQVWSRMVWSLFVKRGVASASLAVMLRVPWFGLEYLFRDVGKHPRPVLLIWGEHDHLNPPKTAEKIYNFFSNAFLLVVKGAQHIVIADKPQNVYDALWDFLRMPSDVKMKDPPPKPNGAAAFTNITARHQTAADAEHIVVGSRCEVQPGRRRGAVRYLGEVAGMEGIWVGIELDDPMGKNDGAMGQYRYFTADKDHGLFSMPKNVVCGDFPVEAGGDRPRLLSGAEGSRLEALSNMPAPGIIGAGKLATESANQV